MALLIIGILCAILDWYAVTAHRRTMEYFAKPATMVFLISWYLYRIPSGIGTIELLFLLGFILSLIGDIFLMLPANYFIAGLLAFLLAHVAFICGFNIVSFYYNSLVLLFLLVILIIAAPIYIRLRRALMRAGNRSLVLPVTIYVVVISMMVWSASITLVRPEWLILSAILATIGAMLFFASDAVLAWNRFVQPLRHGRLINMIMYHLAQYLIAFSVLSHLGRF